jgi:two-component sensor histidine kinase
VRSIAPLHEQLYQSKHLADVSIAAYAEALIPTLLRANVRGAVHLSIDNEARRASRNGLRTRLTVGRTETSS